MSTPDQPVSAPGEPAPRVEPAPVPVAGLERLESTDHFREPPKMVKAPWENCGCAHVRWTRVDSRLFCECGAPKGGTMPTPEGAPAAAQAQPTPAEPLPPRPTMEQFAQPATLERYGLEWVGPTSPVATRMPDGYWTPWHIAEAELTALRADLVRAQEERDAYRNEIEFCSINTPTASRTKESIIREFRHDWNHLIGAEARYEAEVAALTAERDRLKLLVKERDSAQAQIAELTKRAEQAEQNVGAAYLKGIEQGHSERDQELEAVRSALAAKDADIATLLEWARPPRPRTTSHAQFLAAKDVLDKWAAQPSTPSASPEEPR